MTDTPPPLPGVFPDHPHTDPGDGREECDLCGKWVWLTIHSCKRIPVTDAAKARWSERHGVPWRLT